jgi:zeaxanthin glucosyltransferase
MATIALVLDHEEGHLLPTFPLARRLVERGHRVVYMTLPDAGDFVRENGFEVLPILADVFPLGSIAKLRTSTARAEGPVEDDGSGKLEIYEQYLAALVESRELAGAMRALQPDVFVTLSLFSLTALVLRFRFSLPTLLLTPYLRTEPKATFAREVETVLMRMRKGAAIFFELMLEARPRARRLSDVSREVVEMRELILCPEALEIPSADREEEPEVYYIEAPVGEKRLSESSPEFPWKRLDPARKLLLCSMGSQSYLADPALLRRFFQHVARVAQEEPGWQLVLASGGFVEAVDLPGLPEDAVVARWVPQLALLRKAAVMITHGGLGAVREALCCGVPMVVYPIGRDQPDNAERVVHHGMGLAGDLDAATAAAIRSQVLEVDREPSYRQAVARMRERFAEVEGSGIGVTLIEEVACRDRTLALAG